MAGASQYCPHCGAANAPQAVVCFACGHALAPDHLLRGRYRLVRQVGQGGFGAVYQAEDTQLGNRKVAVKEMSQHGLSQAELPEAVAAFHQEALLLAGLTHPNLPRIYEQFAEGGHWYLVMDFIEGQTLEDALRAAPGGRLALEETLELGLQLAGVLYYLHTRQPPIIFRDLKPANVMLAPDGNLYLIDFGIARHFKPGQRKDTVAFGSAGYAAPEQYGRAQTTTQSDIYSLGATLHQLLSGIDPSGSPFVFAPLHLTRLPGLETLIMQMVENRPENRPASMLVVRQELQRLENELAHQPRPAPPTPAPKQTPAPISKPAAPPVTPAPAAPRPITPAPTVAPRRGDVVQRYLGHSDIVKAVAWSPDGRLLVSAGCDESVQLWEVGTGRQVVVYRGHKHQVNGVAWSPDGKRIASCDAGGMVRVWEAATGQTALVYEGHKGLAVQVLCVAWSPDGKQIASGGGDGAAQLWEAGTGQHRLLLQSHADLVKAVAWSPDGQELAAGASGGKMQRWELAMQLAFPYTGHTGDLNAVAWSPDGRSLVSGSEDKTARLWQANAQGSLRIYSGHRGPVQAVAWSPDGKLIASAGADRTVQVWEPFNASDAFIYRGHSGAVAAVAWSPDGKTIASAGYDHAVHLWLAR